MYKSVFSNVHMNETACEAQLYTVTRQCEQTHAHTFKYSCTRARTNTRICTHAPMRSCVRTRLTSKRYQTGRQNNHKTIWAWICKEIHPGSSYMMYICLIPCRHFHAPVLWDAVSTCTMLPRPPTCFVRGNFLFESESRVHFYRKMSLVQNSM